MANTQGFRLLDHGGRNDGDHDDTMNNVAFVGLYCWTGKSNKREILFDNNNTRMAFFVSLYANLLAITLFWIVPIAKAQ